MILRDLWSPAVGEWEGGVSALLLARQLHTGMAESVRGSVGEGGGYAARRRVGKEGLREAEAVPQAPLLDQACIALGDELPEPPPEDDITAIPLPDPAEDALAGDTGDELPAGCDLSVDWILDRLRALPVGVQQPQLLDDIRPVLERWRARFAGSVWSRFLRKGRLIKELNEVAPVIIRIRDELPKLLADARASNPGMDLPKITVVDLCRFTYRPK